MVTVAGNAMHPMTPDFGEGGCSTLEDAIVLARNIRGRLSSEGCEGVYIENSVKERRW